MTPWNVWNMPPCVGTGMVGAIMRVSLGSVGTGPLGCKRGRQVVKEVEGGGAVVDWRLVVVDGSLVGGRRVWLQSDLHQRVVVVHGGGGKRRKTMTLMTVETRGLELGSSLSTAATMNIDRHGQ